MSDIKVVHGSCLCNEVRYSCTLPSKWCAHCHCTMCRKYHGAGYVTWVGFDNVHFQLEAGAEHLQWYRSSGPAERGFCKNCGSSLFFRSDRWEGEIHVTLASLNDPIDRQPQAQVFFEHRVDWMAVDEDLPVFDASS